MILGVPSLWRYELLDRLIASALAGTRVPDEILVVDNGGKYEPKDSRVRVLYSGENLGVAASWNRLLRAGAWVISNDDVVFTRRTFEEMASALEAGTLFVNGLGWALFGQRPEVVEKIGFYDERFFPAYYEDDDYEVRLIDAGIPTRFPVLSEPVEHVGWASSRKLEDGELRDPAEHQALYRKNCQVFTDKWGGSTDQVKAEHRARREGHAAMLLARERNIVLVNGKPLLGLCMIVKNEARRLASVLASYRPYIDTWTILDTGSTDGTQELIKRELDGIPGALHEEPFVDFATSRNRALALHGQSTVFSIMPNGDVLQGGAKLRSFLEAYVDDRAGAYRVRISPGHYYHPLVMRTGTGWHYKWRTHECAMGPNVGPQIPGVTVVRDRGSRTDAEWRQRWERDIVLLNQDRTEDPSDPRPYFYLGQTHECLGQYAEALPFFERRTELGGYFDEVYEAKFRIGKMKDKLGQPWAEIQQAYLEAYAHDPRRAEPLYAIPQYWYDKGIHAVSRLFAVIAAEMPKPPTDLFLDEDVYTWKAADRAAISSFYSGHKADGRDFAEQAVSYRPNDERLRANRAFYAQSAIELFGATAHAIEFAPEPGWNVSNPSICLHEGRLRCIVRTVNYKLTDGNYVTPDGIIRTRNFLVELDDNFKTLRTLEMVDRTGEARTSFPVRGFEDARLFPWKNKWWATATVRDFTDHGRPELALLQLDDDGAVVRAEPLRGPWSVHAQKNWMPLVDGDAAKFIYATSLNGDVGSTIIFDLVETNDVDAHPRYAILPPAGATYAHGRLRGGSQAVHVDGGWIFCVHDVAFPGSARLYLHRFVLIDEKLQLVSMTDPFYFEKLGIEFCAGLALVDEKLVASYAVNDGSARLGIFDWQRVRKALRKDFVI